MTHISKITNPQEFERLDAQQLSKAVFSITDRPEQAPIVFKKKIFTDEHVFSYSFSVRGLVFEDCYFLEDISFTERAQGGALVFRNCFFDKELCFKEVEFKNSLTFEKGIFKTINFFSGSYNIIRCDSEVENFVIQAGEYKYLKVESGTIGNLLIHALKSSLRGFIHLSGKFKKLSIAGTNENCNIQITNLEVGIVWLKELFANGLLKFNGLKSLALPNEKSKFIIEDSDLGKTYFNLVDFNSFEDVCVVQSSIIDCQFTNITWSKKIKPIPFSTFSIPRSTSVPNELLQQKEVYRQLKYALNKQGDYLQEMKFHILEMNTHYESLKWKSIRIGDKLILATSKIFSDYGQSLFRPITWMLVIHLILFWTWIGFDKSDGMELSIDYNGQALSRAIGEFTRLLNPVHKFDDSLVGGYVILDLLMRMFGSYFLYLIIRASRKFIKGS